MNRGSWMDNHSNENCNNSGGDQNNNRKQCHAQRGPLASFQEQNGVRCGRKQFPRGGGSLVLQPKMTPWHQLKLLLSSEPQVTAPFSAPLGALLSSAIVRIITHREFTVTSAKFFSGCYIPWTLTCLVRPCF